MDCDGHTYKQHVTSLYEMLSQLSEKITNLHRMKLSETIVWFMHLLYCLVRN